MRFQKDGSFVYLAEVNLAVGEPIQVLPLGKKVHPEYGVIDITPEMCQKFVANFDAKVRGIDTPLNYAHGNDISKGEKAAGWIKSLDYRPGSGLWAVPDWTPEAEKEIKDKEWRYISAEYRDQWIDPTGKAHYDVLMGAALTNKPFMKDMAPINFEEFEEGGDNLELADGTGVATCNLSPLSMQKHLATCHNLSMPVEPHDALYIKHFACSHGPTAHEHNGSSFAYEDVTVFTFEDGTTHEYRFRDIPQATRDKASASDFAGKNQSFPILAPEDVSAALHSIGRAGPDNYDSATLRANILRIAKRKGFPLPKSATKAAEEGGDVDVKTLAEAVGLSEDDGEDKVLARVKKLSEFFLANKPEDKPRSFADDYPEEAKRLADKDRELAEAKADAQILVWNRAGLPPVVNAKVKAFVLGDKTIQLSDDKTEDIAFSDIVDGILKAGIVERGTGVKDDTIDMSDPQEAFQTEIRKLQEKNEKLSYRDARKQVAREHPALAEAVLNNSKTG